MWPLSTITVALIIFTRISSTIYRDHRTRYTNQDIYTSVGSILAAINPYVLIPSLYDADKMELYANMDTDANVPPHPYELMELAYR